MNEIAKSRKERLRACERALAEHMEEFVKVGLALKEIRRKDPAGWPAFCHERFHESAELIDELLGFVGMVTGGEQ